ncbi:hypothetical protein QEG98_03560 [Myxococcus sp. MxC21-1]|nr:hypothetical protein [Myxococcus sp. MxC21-1]WNZ62902.1 hypothetical protein QEG98_03560 [Myxococcus sp. MxC21-1]
MSLRDWLSRWSWGGAPVPAFYDESYRLPLTGIESSAGIEPRGVDFTTGISWRPARCAPRTCTTRSR